MTTADWVASGIAALALIVSVVSGKFAWSADKRARETESRSLVNRISVDIVRDQTGEWVVKVENNSHSMARKLIVIPYLRADDDSDPRAVQCKPPAVGSWYGEAVMRDQIEPGAKVTEVVRGLPNSSSRATAGWVYGAYIVDSRGQHWRRALQDEWQPIEPAEGDEWRKALVEVRRRFAILEPHKTEALWEKYGEDQARVRQLSSELSDLHMENAGQDRTDVVKQHLNEALAERDKTFAGIQDQMKALKSIFDSDGEQ